MNSTTQEISAWESFKIQRRVIGALLMREILDRWGRHNIGFLWMFAEPMVFTLGVMTLWSLTGASHGLSITSVGFAITGYSSILLWRNMPVALAPWLIHGGGESYERSGVQVMSWKALGSPGPVN